MPNSGLFIFVIILSQVQGILHMGLMALSVLGMIRRSDRAVVSLVTAFHWLNLADLVLGSGWLALQWVVIHCLFISMMCFGNVYFWWKGRAIDPWQSLNDVTCNPLLFIIFLFAEYRYCKGSGHDLQKVRLNTHNMLAVTQFGVAAVVSIVSLLLLDQNSEDEDNHRVETQILVARVVSYIGMLIAYALLAHFKSLEISESVNRNRRHWAFQRLIDGVFWVAMIAILIALVFGKSAVQEA
jgi:hypothetical protein